MYLPGQIGIPGTQEFVIILMIFALYIAVPVALVLIVLRLLRRSPNDERVQELEREVAELRGRLDEREQENSDDE